MHVYASMSTGQVQPHRVEAALGTQPTQVHNLGCILERGQTCRWELSCKHQGCVYPWLSLVSNMTDTLIVKTLSVLKSLVGYPIPEYFNCSCVLLLHQLLVLLTLCFCRMLDYLSRMSFFFFLEEWTGSTLKMT